MIKLETQFVSGEGGFSASPLTYTQLARTEKVAIYERSRDGMTRDYEVFRIKILPKGTQIFKTVTEDDEEKYSSTGQFGFNAWSFNNRAAAFLRYEELNKDLVKDPAEKEEQKTKLTIPVGEFSTKDLAEVNQVDYSVAFLWIKFALGEIPPKIQFLREERRAVKGKLSKIYTKI